MTGLDEKRQAVYGRAEKLATEYFLRYGRMPVELKEVLAATVSDAALRKFNPYHDALGRFTFGPENWVVVPYSGGILRVRDPVSLYWPVRGKSDINPKKLAQAITDFARMTSSNGQRSMGLCASFVRRAIQATSDRLKNWPPVAKEYGRYLIAMGFVRLDPRPTPNYTPQMGDVVVIQPYHGGSQAGHIAIYNGKHWVSDHIQNWQNIPEHDNIWPGDGYRLHKPSYEVYRP